MTTITAVITAHHEGPLLSPSLRNLLATIEVTRATGIEIELLAALDRGDDATRSIFAANSLPVIECDFGDQGKTRNRAAGLSRGDYIAFLDGDDLWSENWLIEACRTCLERPGKIIAHPEYNWFFGGSQNVFLHMDPLSEFYEEEALRFANYWDALCMAPRAAHLDHPYADRDLKSGFAFEDWQWNCETLEAGFEHRLATGTIHFKRRRPDSQTIDASRNNSLIRPTRLFSYEWRTPGR